MAARFFFGDDEQMGDVGRALCYMTDDEFTGVLGEGPLQMPEKVMGHLLAPPPQEAPRPSRVVEVVMGLNHLETARVYFWKGDTVEWQTPGDFRQEELFVCLLPVCPFLLTHPQTPMPTRSKSFLAAVIKGANRRLELLCAVGRASEELQKHSSMLAALVDPTNRVVYKEAMAKFSMPHVGDLPQGRKRKTMDPLYKEGVLRELEFAPGRMILQTQVKTLGGSQRVYLLARDVPKAPPLSIFS